jgi:hypothetical protein
MLIKRYFDINIKKNFSLVKKDSSNFVPKGTIQHSGAIKNGYYLGTYTKGTITTFFIDLKINK